MVDKRITDLTAASAIGASDVFAVDRVAGTRKISINDLFANSGTIEYTIIGAAISPSVVADSITNSHINSAAGIAWTKIDKTGAGASDIGAAESGHNHDLNYAALSHNHDASYANISHNHTGVYEPANTNIQSHISSNSNPHLVSKTDVGLGNVPNTDCSTTSNIVEGTNLFYTDARADARIAASDKVSSNISGITGADQITNIISLTQVEYDAIGTPDSSTFYIITG